MLAEHPLRGRFDTLTIDRTRRWLRLSPLATPLRLPQLLHHTRPQPLATPPPEIAINRIPVVEILGQHTPLTAGLIDIENSIDDLSYVAWRACWSAGMPFLLRQQRFQDRPLLIAQIRCIVIRGTPDRHLSR